MRRRILVADDLGAEGLEILRSAGEVTVKTGMDEATLAATLPGHDALVVRSATKVTARALEGADRLAVIGRAGIGVDNIDLPAATELGIAVMNTPDAGAVTTAEHAIALLVAMARRIPAADRSMKAGKWDKKSFTGVEMTGKVLGVVGLGNIGRVVAQRGLGLGMEVLAHDPYVEQEGAPAGVRLVDLDTLCATADFVTIHVPLLDATRHLMNRDRIRSMKPGARLVHAARGGIVDDAAVLEALQDGHLAGAALDVFEAEPLAEDHPFRSMEQVVLTPHIGASTAEAKRNIAIALAEQIKTCLTQGVVLNGVNVPRIDPAMARAIAPFLELAHHLTVFLTGMHAGTVESVRLTLQGGLVAPASRPLLITALAAALRDAGTRAVTAVNAERIATELGVRRHAEVSDWKTDFANVIRVELTVDGARHTALGTVLGHRHGRLVELDGVILDAIPEPPLLVTEHRDAPGVLGRIGTCLGELGVNVDRMQLARRDDQQHDALAIWNLSEPLTDDQLAAVRALDVVGKAHRIG